MRLKQIVRSLARMPGFTSVATLTLAIGIGANTAVFGVVQSVLLKPLPYPQSDRLVALDHAAPGVKLASAGAAPFQYFTYREEARVFQDVGLWNVGTVSVTGLAEPEEVRTLFATDAILRSSDACSPRRTTRRALPRPSCSPQGTGNPGSEPIPRSSAAR
jgi:hypothetical protein